MDEIKAAREALGITQDELAERIGVSRPVVTRWETTGKFPPHIPEPFNALVTTLRLSPEMMLREMGVTLYPPAAARLPRELLTGLLSLDSEDLGNVTSLVQRLAGSPRQSAGGTR